jgi:hypothetical protein
MSERKTIQFNPALLVSTANNKTRKNRAPSEKRIRIREENQERKKTLKRNLLNMIRSYQEDKLKNTTQNNVSHSNEKQSAGYSESFNNDFEESLKYLDSLTKETKPSLNQKPTHNYTLKNYNDISTIGGKLSTNENVNISLPDTFLSVEPMPLNSNSFTPQSVAPMNINVTDPPYGILKDGMKPTWRNYNNQTQKIHRENNIVFPTDIQPEYERQKQENNELSMNKRDISTIKQLLEKKENERKVKYTNLVNKRHKKIARRTFKIGKSKRNNTISVLVSNRTIRNNIANKKHQLSQMPINDVKRFLIKKGFIKVGTVAPNDVLRKMYESALLMCGEIENH